LAYDTKEANKVAKLMGFDEFNDKTNGLIFNTNSMIIIILTYSTAKMKQPKSNMKSG